MPTALKPSAMPGAFLLGQTGNFILFSKNRRSESPVQPFF